MLVILLVAAVITFTCGSLRADDDVSELARNNSAFALDLYSQLSGSEGNLFFSPYSISMALAMTQAGARGETKLQMTKALRFSLPQDRLPSSFAQLRGRLKDAQGDNNVTLDIANSVWPSDRYKIHDKYINLLKSNYDVALTPLDYSKSESARDTINKWVEAKTRGKIKDLVWRGALTTATRLTLVNAIYFYGKWQSPFQPKDTDKHWDFH